MFAADVPDFHLFVELLAERRELQLGVHLGQKFVTEYVFLQSDLPQHIAVVHDGSSLFIRVFFDLVGNSLLFSVLLSYKLILVVLIINLYRLAFWGFYFFNAFNFVLLRLFVEESAILGYSVVFSPLSRLITLFHWVFKGILLFFGLICSCGLFIVQILIGILFINFGISLIWVTELTQSRPCSFFLLKLLIFRYELIENRSRIRFFFSFLLCINLMVSVKRREVRISMPYKLLLRFLAIFKVIVEIE